MLDVLDFAPTLIGESDYWCSNVASVLVPQVLDVVPVTTSEYSNDDTARNNQGLLSKGVIQLTYNYDLALTLQQATVQSPGNCDMFRTLPRTLWSPKISDVCTSFVEVQHLVILEQTESGLSLELHNLVISDGPRSRPIPWPWPLFPRDGWQYKLPWTPIQVPSSQKFYLAGTFQKHLIILVVFNPWPYWELSILVVYCHSTSMHFQRRFSMQKYTCSGGFFVILNGTAEVQRHYYCPRALADCDRKGWISRQIQRGNTQCSELIEWSSLHSEFGSCTPGNILFCSYVLVPWEIPPTVILESWKLWLQYCSAGHEYPSGYENFRWIIVWSLSCHYSLSSLHTLSACVLLLVQQNYLTICKELWFRFLIGFRIVGYDMLSRSNSNCSSSERFVIEHWLMLRNSGDVLVYVLCPTRPHDVLCPTRPHAHVPISRPDDDGFSYVLVLGQECITLQPTKNVLHLQQAKTTFLQVTTDAGFIEYSSLIGCELLNWKIAWPLYLVCSTSGNKSGKLFYPTEVRCQGTASIVPIQFLDYNSMWSFSGLEFCQRKLSWDPGIWALLRLFRFFTQDVEAPASYRGHYLSHAYYFDIVSDDQDYSFDVFRDQVRIGKDYYIHILIEQVGAVCYLNLVKVCLEKLSCSSDNAIAKYFCQHIYKELLQYLYKQYLESLVVFAPAYLPIGVVQVAYAVLLLESFSVIQKNCQLQYGDVKWWSDFSTIDGNHRTKANVGCVITATHFEQDLESECRTLIRHCPSNSDGALVDRIPFPLLEFVVKLVRSQNFIGGTVHLQFPQPLQEAQVYLALPSLQAYRSQIYLELFGPAGKASLYSYGAVDIQWEIAWPTTTVSNSMHYGMHLYIALECSSVIYYLATEINRMDIHSSFLLHLHWDPGGLTQHRLGMLQNTDNCPKGLSSWSCAMLKSLCGFELLHWKIAWSLDLGRSDGGNSSGQPLLPKTVRSEGYLEKYEQVEGKERKNAKIAYHSIIQIDHNYCFDYTCYFDNGYCYDAFLNCISFYVDFSDPVQCHVMQWDPGGAAWWRLEGKPHFKGGGMLATTSTTTVGHNPVGRWAGDGPAALVETCYKDTAGNNGEFG